MSARQDLVTKTPWLNAAGCLGFLPSADHWLWPEPQGAWITPPVSLARRTPAGNRCALPYPGGLLLHTGLANPGLNDVLRRCAARWAQSGLPVWLHLLGDSASDINRMVQAVEGQEGIQAIELGVPPTASANEARDMVSAAVGELPLIVNVPLHRAHEGWLRQLAGLGASALSLGAPRGMLPGPQGLISGRLYGPAIFPQALAALRSVRRFNLPVIASGGIYEMQTAQTLLQAGAWAVQLDTVLWRGAPKLPTRS